MTASSAAKKGVGLLLTVGPALAILAWAVVA